MSQSALPSIVHVSVGTNDVDTALAFYDSVLATIGLSQQVLMEGIGAAYGRSAAEFWVHLPLDEAPATVGNGVHVAFSAHSHAEVDAFYHAALAAGAADEGAAGLRPEYGPQYYACFVRDPDGNKIEAVCMGSASEQA